MTCERCGKVIIAPIEYGNFYICKDCNYEGNYEDDVYPEYSEEDTIVRIYGRHPIPR